MKSCCENLIGAGLNPETCDHVVAREMRGAPRLMLVRSPINRARAHLYLAEGDAAARRGDVRIDVQSIHALNRMLAQFSVGSSIQAITVG
jgi:hypothetical protein